jgi:predicted permease
VFNLMLFSYGVMLFEKKLSLKHVVRAIINPNVIAIILGALFFLFSIQLPSALSMPISYVGAIMTPLSLICIGYMLSTAKLMKILKKKMLIITCVAQLILGPAIAYGLLTLIGAPSDVVHVIVLIQALPTATTLGLFAEKYGGDTSNASELVAVSTVLSAVTLPVLMLVVFNLL